MKKTASIILIFALFAQSTSQLWMLASFYYNRDFIAANLCINRFDKIAICKGSCYLEKRFNENKQQQEKLPDLKTKEISLYTPEHYQLSNIESFSMPKLIYPLYNNSFLENRFLQSVFHPPC